MASNVSSNKELRLVVVTPETTLLDQSVRALRFPLEDGQIGILPGRAPLIGRLGYGELKVSTPHGDRAYFIDGGFVQVKGSVVSILTDRAMPVDAIQLAEAESQLQAALEQVARSDSELEDKRRAQQRARRLRDLARKTSAIAQGSAELRSPR